MNNFKTTIIGLTIVLVVTAMSTCTTLSVQACSQANMRYDSGLEGCVRDHAVMK